jgi:hypothetical protein
VAATRWIALDGSRDEIGVSVNVDQTAEKEGAVPAPPRKESVWVLEQADNLLGDIAKAIWLSVASVWRIPRAAMARYSMDRLEVLVVRRQILPPRLSLLVASIASVLLLAFLLPERTAHLTTDTLLSYLATTSPGSLLLAAAPALISLWLTVLALSRLLHLAAGAVSRDPADVLMQVASGVVILSCLGIMAIGLVEARLNAVMRGLPDLAIITGFWLMMLLLAVAGVKCVQQMTASSACSSVRRRVVLFVGGPLAFVSSVLIALVATYWLLQAQALGARMVDEGKPPSAPSALAPTCYVMAGSVVCQVLLSARSDLAIGLIRQVDIKWRDLQRSGQSTKISLLQQSSQIVQLTPHAEPGGFWTLRAKEPSPFAFQIPAADACRLHLQIAAFKRRVEPIPGVPPRSLLVQFTIYWQPGFGLLSRKDAGFSPEAWTNEFEDSTFETGLATLCSEEPATPPLPNGGK